MPYLDREEVGEAVSQGHRKGGHTSAKHRGGSRRGLGDVPWFRGFGGMVSADSLACSASAVSAPRQRGDKSPRRRHHAVVTTPSSPRRRHHTVVTTPSSPRRRHHAVVTTPSSPRRRHHAVVTTPSSPRRRHHAVVTATPPYSTRPPHGCQRGERDPTGKDRKTLGRKDIYRVGGGDPYGGRRDPTLVYRLRGTSLLVSERDVPLGIREGRPSWYQRGTSLLVSERDVPLGIREGRRDEGLHLNTAVSRSPGHLS
ncbi:hypothetical protein NHX12_024792, partial [Muraenolepis orangiensis]